MRQIARCPACATMFRVAAEQLEMAHGWVRCGKCSEVFDAGLHLLPGSSPAPASMDTQQLPGPMSGLDHAGMAGAPVPSPELSAPAMAEPEFMPAVGFVQDTGQQSNWNLPLVRAALSLACVVLSAALLGQLAVSQKDVLAAQEPRLAPLLQAACRLLGCEVRPLRRIESLLIDQASFSKIGIDAYRLSFVFRNTGDAAVEVPALEVTLTDSQDQALVRRVIMPAQFAASTVTLAAYTELAGALSLKVAGAGNQAALPPARSSALPVASYRILAFYP